MGTSAADAAPSRVTSKDDHGDHAMVQPAKIAAAHAADSDRPNTRALPPLASRAARRKRDRRRPLTWMLGLSDVVMLAAAAVAAEVTVMASAAMSPWNLVLYGGLALAIMAARGGYRQQLSPSVAKDLHMATLATAVAVMVSATASAALSSRPNGMASAAALWLFSLAFVTAGRSWVYWTEHATRCRGVRLRRTLIVGAGVVGQVVAQRLLADPGVGLVPIGFLDKEPREGTQLPVLGASWDLEDVVQRSDVEHVVVCFSTAPDDVLLRLFDECERLNVGVTVVPRLFERMPSRLTLEHLGGIPLMSIRRPNPRGLMFGVKHALDRVVAVVLLTLVTPLLVAAAIGVLVSLGRPIFFRQPRISRGGQPFDMLKFRTMTGRPEERGESDAGWARRQLGEADAEAGTPDVDHRTRVGRVLRKSSIDELPQLLNVVRGEMSLVGPRPERIHYVDVFQDQIYRYNDRHRVKSGITGWAQVNGLRGNTSLADRVEWDNYYVENWSLLLDLKILGITLVSVVKMFRQVE